MKKNLTAAQRRQIADLYASDAPLKIIAHRYDIHETTAIKIAREHGVPARNEKTSAYSLGRMAVRLGLTLRDLELLAQLRGNPPMHGGQDRSVAQTV